MSGPKWLEAFKEPKNLKRSDEFVFNNRGQKLHVRSTIPDKPTGIIVFVHGYGAHGNRPTALAMGQEFSEESLVFMSIDLSGHGYSQGDRGLVSNFEHLIDDLMSLLIELLRKDNSEEGHLNYRNLKRLPIYLMGHSMGGGTCILVSHIISKGGDSTAQVVTEFTSSNALAIKELQDCFKGAMLFCPLVEIGLPNALRWLLINPMALISPTGSLPLWIIDENEGNSSTWADPKYIEYIVSDGYPRNEKGISWGGNVQFQTLSSLLLLSDAVSSILSDVTFPFVIFHDPEEIVCKYSGSKALFESAKSECKQLKHMDGKLHDLIANDTVTSIEKCKAWLKEISK